LRGGQSKTNKPSGHYIFWAVKNFSVQHDAYYKTDYSCDFIFLLQSSQTYFIGVLSSPMKN